MMTKTTNSNYNLPNLALYRYQRYQQSIAENPNFYFGPLSLLLYGAASFLYELMPSGTRNYNPDFYTISSFFGAGAKQKNGSYAFTGKEKIPDNWTNRVSRKLPSATCSSRKSDNFFPAAYSNMDVTNQIVSMYLLHPVLFGGNTGNGTFDALTTSDGMITAGVLDTTSITSVTCLLYQLATERIPSSLNSVLTPTVTAIDFAVSKLGGAYSNLGCPLPLTKRR